MRPLQKTEILEIGHYRLERLTEKTKLAYRNIPRYDGNDTASQMFMHHMKNAPEEALRFLSSLGIDPTKLHSARPLAEPDENGEVLFFCAARFCGRLLSGGECYPHRSVEKAGMSLIFVADRSRFQTGPYPVPEPQLELRFVIPLPFDAAFFDRF